MWITCGDGGDQEGSNALKAFEMLRNYRHIEEVTTSCG
jgi:hypothetical protein